MLVLNILLQQAKEHMPMEDLVAERYLVQMVVELELVRQIKDMTGIQEVVQMQVYGLVVEVVQEQQEIIPVLEEQV